MPSAVSISSRVTLPALPLQAMLRRGAASQYRTLQSCAKPASVPSNDEGGVTQPLVGAEPYRVGDGLAEDDVLAATMAADDEGGRADALAETTLRVPLGRRAEELRLDETVPSVACASVDERWRADVADEADDLAAVDDRSVELDAGLCVDLAAAVDMEKAEVVEEEDEEEDGEEGE